MGSFVLLSQPVFHVVESTVLYRTGKCNISTEHDHQDGEHKDMQPHGDDDHHENEHGHQIEEKWSWGRWTKYFVIRGVVLLAVFFISILIPNLNILLILIGAIFGTVANVWIPVLFYNRAYNLSEKNTKHEVNGPKRICIKILSWVVFALGTIIGFWGLVYVCFEMSDAHEDEV